MQITFSTHRITRFLAVAIILLTITSVCVQYAKYYLGHNQLLGAVRVFDADREGNLPTWYSSVTLLVCAMLLAVVSISKMEKRSRYRFHWAVLSGIFLYFSLDEGAAIHELMNLPIRSFLHVDSYFYWSWVVVGIAFVLAFLIVYARFILDLPARIRNLFIVAGIIFVTGAIGLELVGGNYIFMHGDETDLTYALMTSSEEFLEMTGVLIFIYALMTYLEYQEEDLQIVIKK